MPRKDMEISRIEKSINVDEIVSRMHSYEIRGEHVPWRFVDRKGEVESILGREGFVEVGRITVLYGPKGCGRSTLSDVLANAADQAGAGLDVMVIERPESAVQMAVLRLPRSFRDLARSIAGYVAEGFKISSTGPLIEFTSTPTYIVWKIAEYIAHRLRRGRKILIVLDEVGVDSQEHLNSFRQWLENFANDIKKYNRDYSEKGGSIAVIALTSDALAREIRHVVGGKVSWALIWNLSRVSSEELASQIGLHHRVARELGVDSEKAGETLWRLAGGN